MTEEHPVIKTKWGYYRIKDMPSNEELQTYYRDKYYQEGRGSYEVSYTDDEVQWFRLRADILRLKSEQVTGGTFLSLLDVGCGEGWLMQCFHDHGHRVRGVDFSVAGIEKLHPKLMPHFEQGDLYTYLEKAIETSARYDVVSCCNVVEHVPDPARLFQGLRMLINDNGYLVLTVPNDFSPLHQHLLDAGYVESPWWIRYPDHLSYFNKESMIRLLEDLGLKAETILADNPIDLNLLNDNSNYIREPDKGKAVHRFRIRMDNLLGSLGLEKLMNLYEAYGAMGVGRNLTYFVSKA